MFLYITIEAVVGMIVGLYLAVRTKKEEGVVYTRLDKAGRITNILLLLFYVGFSYVYLMIGVIARPNYDGFLGLVGWIVSIIMASAALACSVGLGASVALRKKGRSKQSFAVQFVGFVVTGGLRGRGNLADYMCHCVDNIKGELFGS